MREPAQPLPALSYLFLNLRQRLDGDSQQVKGLHLKAQTTSPF